MIVIEHDGIVAPEYIFFLWPHLHICCKLNIKDSQPADRISMRVIFSHSNTKRPGIGRFYCLVLIVCETKINLFSFFCH